MKKRLLSVLLTLCMVLSLLPVGALADGDVTVENADALQAAVSVATGDALVTAVAGSEVGDTVRLTENVTLTSQLTIDEDKDVILDLNGNTLTLDATAQILVEGGILTITDSSGTPGELITNVDGGLRVLKGTLTLDKGTYTCNNSDWNRLVYVNGSEEEEADYSIVNIHEDAEVRFTDGAYGFGVVAAPYYEYPGGEEVLNKAQHGIVLNIDGKVDATLVGASIYINGNITDVTNTPIVNISKTAELTGMAYAAGYATWNIDGSIKGETGIEIRAGEVTISENAHIIGTAAPT